ncbi:MAG TPA: DUF885 family protein [Streptosporangiaceae bacterium]|nr:DUF885 family protein [Streptosporangiaceae bacterium]
MRWPASRWAWTRSPPSAAASTNGRCGSSCCTPPATAACRCPTSPPTRSIADAAAGLADRVPMDEATAREEAAFFAETPGQALTYQIGKTQLIALIADAVRVRGADLDLQSLHDAIWVNGNVPVALLRWELLGLTDELPAIDTE